MLAPIGLRNLEFVSGKPDVAATQNPVERLGQPLRHLGLPMREDPSPDAHHHRVRHRVNELFQPVLLRVGIVVQEGDDVAGRHRHAGVPGPRQALGGTIGQHENPGTTQFEGSSAVELFVVVDHDHDFVGRACLVQARLDRGGEGVPPVHGVRADDDGNAHWAVSIGDLRAGVCCSQRFDPIDTGLFATPSAWYSFAPTSHLHETLKALPSDPVQTTTRSRLDPSLLFGLRRVLDPKPACPLFSGRTRHRSESPAQADGYVFIVIDAALLRIGQKVTSISHVGALRAPTQGDRRRGPHRQDGHTAAPRVPGAPVGGHRGRPMGLAGGPMRRSGPLLGGDRQQMDSPTHCSHMSLSAPRWVPLGE